MVTNRTVNRNRRSVTLMLGVTVAIIAMAALGIGVYRGTSAATPLAAEPADRAGEAQDLAAADPLRERWGVEVLSIRTTASGYLLDFRYRVHDADKAAPLLDRRIKPYIEVDKSDARLGVPVTNKLGALRQSTQHVIPDRNYFILFTNPGRHVVPGDRVSVVIGDFVAEDLSVIN